MGPVSQGIEFNQTPNSNVQFLRSQNGAAKRVAREGNNPDCRLRPLNEC